MISYSNGKLRRANADQRSVPLYEMCLLSWKFRKDTLVESTHDGPLPLSISESTLRQASSVIL